MVKDRLSPSGHPALFLAVRYGIPSLLALLCLTGAVLAHRAQGWWLLLAVVCLAEISATVRSGNQEARMRWCGRWVQGCRPIARWLGLEEAWMRAFIAWNNRGIEKHFRQEKARRALLLLPHCSQLTRCKVKITEAIENCPRCGQCPLGEAWPVAATNACETQVFNRSHKAARYARAYKPDLIIAISCTDRLIKGVRKLPDIPCYGIPLELPHGMCVDTTFSTECLLDAVRCMIHPKVEPTSNIQPFNIHDIA